MNEVLVFSIDGKLLEKVEPKGDGTVDIDASLYPAGLYLAKVITTTGEEVTQALQRLIKALSLRMERLKLRICLLMFFAATTLVSAQDSSAEKSPIYIRYLENMLGPQKDPSAPQLINYPAIAYAPETSWEIGVSSLYVYSANRNLENRLSEIKAYTFFTLENQYGFWLDHALYTDMNKWFFYGRARYQNFPLFYYGIGRESPSEYTALIDGSYTLFRERLLRETLPSLYFGLELDFQSLNQVSYVDTRPDFEFPQVGTMGSTNLGIGLGLLYNNIHNAMNPREGLYSEWAFMNYRTSMGSDFDFSSYIIDNRIYRPVKENTCICRSGLWPIHPW